MSKVVCEYCNGIFQSSNPGHECHYYVSGIGRRARRSELKDLEMVNGLSYFNDPMIPAMQPRDNYVPTEDYGTGFILGDHWVTKQDIEKFGWFLVRLVYYAIAYVVALIVLQFIFIEIPVGFYIIPGLFLMLFFLEDAKSSFFS